MVTISESTSFLPQISQVTEILPHQIQYTERYFNNILNSMCPTENGAKYCHDEVGKPTYPAATTEMLNCDEIDLHLPVTHRKQDFSCKHRLISKLL